MTPFSCALCLAVTVKAEECVEVRGRYAIYVERDSLWIIGSKHFLDVGSDDLDKELERRGWEDTVAYGWFTICGEHTHDPKKLTAGDAVRLKSYRGIEFRIRAPRPRLANVPAVDAQ